MTRAQKFFATGAFHLTNRCLVLAAMLVSLQACGSDSTSLEKDSLQDSVGELAENDVQAADLVAADTAPADAQAGEISAGDAPADDTVADVPVANATLKVMSFNLRTGFAFDEENSWKNREPIVTQFLALEDPDVVGAQEALVFQIDAIIAALPHYGWVGIGRNGTEFEEFVPIFYNTDRFELLDSGTFWLSDTPDEVGTKFTENQEYLRIVTWAHLKQRLDGAEIFHFNTHYDLAEVDNITERSSALILKKMAELAGDKPVFLTGDFNENVGELSYQILVGQAEWEGQKGTLLDPWTELGVPEEGSFHKFTGVATEETRIDWILHSAHYTPLEAVVSHYNQDGHYPSDHFPIWATFETP